MHTTFTRSDIEKNLTYGRSALCTCACAPVLTDTSFHHSVAFAPWFFVCIDTRLGRKSGSRRTRRSSGSLDSLSRQWSLWESDCICSARTAACHFRHGCWHFAPFRYILVSQAPLQCLQWHAICKRNRHYQTHPDGVPLLEVDCLNDCETESAEKSGCPCKSACDIGTKSTKKTNNLSVLDLHTKYYETSQVFENGNRRNKSSLIFVAEFNLQTIEWSRNKVTHGTWESDSGVSSPASTDISCRCRRRPALSFCACTCAICRTWLSTRTSLTTR